MQNKPLEEKVSIFKKRISKKAKLQIIATIVAFVAVITLIIIDIANSGPLTSLLTNREKATELIKSFGPLAPIGYIVLQILQTVVAPIPGQVVGILGGLIFGWWGVLWTVIGSAIGFFLVFSVSRKFGRSMVEKLVKKEYLDKFDFIAGKKAPLILFIIFVLPGFPDDVVCYLAGLTEIPIKQLMTMIVIGRLPAVVMSNIFGDSLGHGNTTAMIWMVAISAVMIGAAAIFNKQIIAFFKKLNRAESEE